MGKLGIKLDADEHGHWIRWDGAGKAVPGSAPSIRTYQDHRMAMAFAPAAIKLPGLVIEDPEVVHKSYPRFWDDLKSVGFSIRDI